MLGVRAPGAKPGYNTQYEVRGGTKKIVILVHPFVRPFEVSL